MSRRYPVAIDLSGGTTLRALQLTTQSGSPVVRAAARREIVPGENNAPSEADLTAFVSGVLRSPAFRGKSVALLAPPGVVLSYPLSVTPGKGVDLETALVREASNMLDFPIDEALLDYVSVADSPVGDGHTRQVLLIVARKREVSRYIDLVKRAGGVLEVLDCTASALYRLHAMTSSLTTKPALLCDVGRTQTALVVATRDAILAHRSVDWGTELLSRKLLENLELSGQERDADFLLREHGLRHAAPPEEDPGAAVDDMSRTIAQLLMPLADEFVHELHNLAGYVRSTASDVVFDKLFLYGQGSRVNSLARYCANELNLDARAMAPLEKIGLRNADVLSGLADDASFARALGLALRRVRWL